MGSSTAIVTFDIAIGIVCVAPPFIIVIAAIIFDIASATTSKDTGQVVIPVKRKDASCHRPLHGPVLPIPTCAKKPFLVSMGRFPL